jgi:hypothetical protein
LRWLENSCAALSNDDALDDAPDPAGGDGGALSPGKMADCSSFVRLNALDKPSIP